MRRMFHSEAFYCMLVDLFVRYNTNVTMKSETTRSSGQPNANSENTPELSVEGNRGNFLEIAYTDGETAESIDNLKGY